MRLALAFLAACSFSKEVPAVNDGPPPVPDGGPCIAKADECVSADMLRSCSGPGATYVDTPCAWGCMVDHCGAFTPAADVVTPAAVSADTSALADLVLPAGTIVNSSGAIGTMATPTSIRAGGAGSQGMIRYATSGAGVVFTVKSLRISGDISLVGTTPIAIIASDGIIIEGIVDARGTCTFADTGGSAGPGGFTGGAKGVATAATGSGGGTGGGAGAGNNARGGGGGGHGGVGGLGGEAVAALGAAGGPSFDPNLTTLVGGGGGGGGGGGSNAAPGGGGGGALQLISSVKIEITASGGINAGGCGGFSASGNADSGGGGGAGGTIVLEAPQIQLTGRLAVNGGGGGAGADQSSMPGEHGSIDRAPALGKTGSGDGGPGGFGSLVDGGPGTFATKSGGGGGAVGRMLFNTRDDARLTFDNTKLSPSFMDVGTTCKRGSANVQ